MKKLRLSILILFITANCFCQTKNLLHIGELTIHLTDLNSLKIGDTLRLDFPKKRSIGTIKIDENKILYEWAFCNEAQTKKLKTKSNWCKIGIWQIDDNEVLFILPSKTYKFSYLPIDNITGKQDLIVTDIK